MHLKAKKKVTYRRWKYARGGMPCLIVEGWFLQQYGFKVGQYTNVSYEKGKITITNPRELNTLVVQGN